MRQDRGETWRQHLLPFAEESEPQPGVTGEPCGGSGGEPEAERCDALLEDAVLPPTVGGEASPYDEKVRSRRAKLEAAADRAAGRSAASYAAAKQVAAQIPMGQPVQRGHRRELERSRRAMGRAAEESRQEEELRAKAEAVGKGGISADDPGAALRLRAKLEDLEAHRERMKVVNQQFRDGGWEGVTAVSESVQARLRRDMELMGALAKVPFPPYMLRNMGAKIRQVKGRISALEKAAARTVRKTEIGPGYFLEEARDGNRIRFVFDGKPTVETRDLLRARGFRWAPSVKAWQRQASEAGWRDARYVHAQLCGETAD